MSKMSIKLKIEYKEYILEEDKEYIFEFKPGYELGNSNNPFSKVRMMNIAFEGANGETCFFVFHEETNEDYLIGDDELISITNM
ncbi:hypothetical protein [Gottfriedia acidiceleris]|uniref:Uncharacterized protein n=1 Tax=Gottfriedia acidiceleris TaxID=371036 RepID=A0ABY4JIH4_9BACI|nr:hypothetical protein [Gottfriedia acidiceleris]UPM52840.1 hypothetical protein MY490_13480 [Gottfriedia acidiceleris]